MTAKPISCVLLCGVYDPGSPLSLLQGTPHLVRRIWEHTTSYWKQMIRLPDPSCRVGSEDYQISPSIQDCEAAAQPFYLAPLRQEPDFCGHDLSSSPPSFPPPSGVNINMMPFLVGETFEACRLPESVRPYWGMVEACIGPELERAGHHLWPRDEVPSQLGKVWYLTVQEGWVEGGTSQRRAGLHVDSPGRVNIANRREEEAGMEGRGVSQLFEGHRWGRGCAHLIGGADKEEGGGERGENWAMDLRKVLANSYIMRGGIYLASSLAGTSRAWDCRVDRQAVGSLGDVEHLREGLPGPGQLLQPGQIYWITDRTPHESLPLTVGAHRQFFRVVTSQVSLWYSSHSTPNPLGVFPDPAVTRTVRGDKFAPEGVQLVHYEPLVDGDEKEEGVGPGT